MNEEKILDLYNHLKTITKLVTDLGNNVNDLKAKSISQQSFIIIIINFIIEKHGKDEFMKFMKEISISNNHTEEVRAAAKEMLNQNNLWSGTHTMQ